MVGCFLSRLWLAVLFSFSLSLSGNISIPMVMGDLMPGQLLASENWGWGSIPEKKLSRFIVHNPDQFKGMLSRYIKKNGDFFYVGDFSIPDVVHNQEKVTLTIRSGRIQVSVPGIALKNGPVGCTIRVLNPATQKILDAVIIDSRNVEVLYN